MRKKILALTLAAVVGVSALAGCGHSSTSQTTAAAPAQEQTTAAPAKEETKEETKAESTTEEKGSEGQPDSSETGNLTTIMEEIYQKKEVELRLQTIEVDLTDEDALIAFTGLSNADDVFEAVASEPMMSSQAYSLVLVRVKEAAKAAEVAAAMAEGINPAKWICVNADEIVVAYHENVVMLFMVSSDLSDVVTVDEISDAFKDVCGGEITVLN